MAHDRGHALIEAIRSGQVEMVRSLLREDAGLLAMRDENGVSAPLVALYHRQMEIVKLVLALKPALDIFAAAAYGQTARVNELLRGDPSLVHAWSPDGGLALHLACYFGHPATVEALLRHGADPTVPARGFNGVAPIHSAAAAHSTEIVRMLLNHGAEANARQAGGWTALHAAAQHGDVEMTRLLLEHGADPHVRSDTGVTPLDLARQGGHNEAAQLLA